MEDSNTSVDIESRPLRSHTNYAVAIGCVVIASVVFLLDLHLPLGMGAPALYLIAIWISLRAPKSIFTIFIAGVTSFFTIVAVFLSPHGSIDHQIVIFNRIIIIVLIWLAALILLHKKGSDRKLQRLSWVASNTKNSVILTNPRGEIEWVNEGFIRLTGYTFSEVIGKKTGELLRGPDSSTKTVKKIAKSIKQKKPFKVEILNYRKDGTQYWVEIESEPVLDADGELNGYFALQTDITERKERSESLENSLKERDVLLKEIHHRVKNNLQVISSIFSLQYRRSDNEDAKKILLESDSRIQSIALLHETLYRSGDLSKIELSSYLKELIDNLSESFKAPKEINISLAGNDLYLDLDSAIPCGLIVNELVSNALKYAFPNPKEGDEISVKFESIQASDPQCTKLKVFDNGIGMPKEVDIESNDTLGLKLVKTLSHQLHGEINIHSNGSGTSFEISFPIGEI